VTTIGVIVIDVISADSLMDVLVRARHEVWPSRL